MIITGLKKIRFGILFLSLFLSGSAFAALNIELTQGTLAAVPIAVVPFDSSQNGSSDDISQIIHQDLSTSGQFDVLDNSAFDQFPHQLSDVDLKYWQDKNVDYIIIGSVKPLQSGDSYQVSFSLLNLYNQPAHQMLLTQNFTVPKTQFRQLAHHISDLIYQKLTGTRGVFSTDLAYVLVQYPQNKSIKYQLMVANQDGFGAKALLSSSQPIMSPSWSPDGKEIAYVSFENYVPQIYISNVATGKRRLVSSFAGINGAPEWSPDGKKLALALSRGKENPNIFILDLASKQLNQITNDWSINTEPNWSPDGKSLIFTSDRGGSPQIYQINLSSKKIKRLTFSGNYNASASYAPDGKHIVLLNRQAHNFNIGWYTVDSGDLKILTYNESDESPSIAPNGQMIVYATQKRGGTTLSMVSIDGRINMQLPDQNGNVQEPAWSPFFNY